ncbi:hypothetical protein RYX36_024121 [Vicia faba]
MWSFYFLLCIFFIFLTSFTSSYQPRRFLHQPFDPQNPLSPSQPPNPSPSPPSPPPPNPKYPFSTNTPNASSSSTPFFPTYPSPPPPPSPSTFASFPANISSLILPQTPKPSSSSSKLLAVAIASVLAALAVLSVSAFIYCRRRRRRFTGDDKTLRSDSSIRLFPRDGAAAVVAKSRNVSSTSSEFLYLGTIVNSRGDDLPDSRGAGGGGRNPRKMDSPELQPLPPLARQGSRVYDGGAPVGDGEDEEEEFYSPRGSLNGNGSGSRRIFAGISAENLVGRSSNESTSSSSSYSSSSASPDRSHSISLSPPVSLSPRRSQSKSPENVLSPAPTQQLSGSDGGRNGRSSVSSSQASSNRNVRSASSMSSTPEKIFAGECQSPSLSPLNLSPTKNSNGPVVKLVKTESCNGDASSPRLSNASSGKSSSSAFTLPSPEKVTMMHHHNNHGLDQSPTISDVSDRFRHSPLSSLPLSPTLLSSPEREMNTMNTQPPPPPPPPPSRKHWEIPDLLTPIAETPSVLIQHGVVSQRKQWEIPVLSTPIAPSVKVSAPPPPPPPPPPAMSLRQRKQWEVPSPTTPVGQPVVCRPPELKPPSRPFVLQTPPNTLVSPVELPPSFEENAEEVLKPKLKPLHWDKVRASSDREMVWDHLRSSSFKLNEEMIETLFVVNTPNPKPKDATPRSVLAPQYHEDRVLDPKKSQNIAILLRAVNVTVEEVCEALLEGVTDTLNTELLESLLKMAPSKEEERKLKEYKEDTPNKLGPAEKFLKAVLDVPFAFKRVEAMLYIANFESEVEYLRKSFQTLEVACEELRNSRMFLKLLEAVLKTGNRMNVGTNRGDAHAFKLDTLLKLVDVKGADGKTTLLHFVVQEIIRTEGARHSDTTTTTTTSVTSQTPSTTSSDDAKCRRLGLQVVSSLSSDLANVKKAAAMDSEVLTSEVSKLSKGITHITEIVKLNQTAGSDETVGKFTESMNKFMKMAEEEIVRIQAQESVALSLVKEITEYFHGNLSKEEAHPFRIFMVVRDFLTVLDRVCKEVGNINERTMISSAHRFPVPVNPMLPQPLPGLHGRKHYSSSDDDNPSP